MHGWGGSFESTWQRSGFTELLHDAGREVLGIDLLGHGTASKPHDPEAYARAVSRVHDAMGRLALNVNEGLMLRNLLWSLPSLAADEVLHGASR